MYFWVRNEWKWWSSMHERRWRRRRLKELPMANTKREKGFWFEEEYGMVKETFLSLKQIQDLYTQLHLSLSLSPSQCNKWGETPRGQS